MRAQLPKPVWPWKEPPLESREDHCPQDCLPQIRRSQVRPQQNQSRGAARTVELPWMG